MDTGVKQAEPGVVGIEGLSEWQVNRMEKPNVKKLLILQARTDLDEDWSAFRMFLLGNPQSREQFEWIKREFYPFTEEGKRFLAQYILLESEAVDEDTHSCFVSNFEQYSWSLFKPETPMEYPQYIRDGYLRFEPHSDCSMNRVIRELYPDYTYSGLHENAQKFAKENGYEQPIGTSPDFGDDDVCREFWERYYPAVLEICQNSTIERVIELARAYLVEGDK